MTKLKLNAFLLLALFYLFCPTNGNAQLVKIDTIKLAHQVDSLFHLKKTPENLPFAEQLERSATRAKNEQLKSKISLWLGIYYRIQGDYDKALAFFFQQNRHAISSGDSLLLCTTNLELAVIYRHMNKHEKALDFLEKSLRLAKHLNIKKKGSHLQ